MISSIPEFKSSKVLPLFSGVALGVALLCAASGCPAQTLEAQKSSSMPDKVGRLRAIPTSRIEAWNGSAFKAYEDNKLTLASRLFLSAARAGDLGAKYNLASMKIRQETTYISLAQALNWMKLAAHGGLAPAQFSYGLLLESGQSLKQDLRASSHWFEEAAKQGHQEAALALATACFLGRGHPLDYEKAALWYEKAAQAGEVAAQYSLASMYLTGLGVKLNLESALLWFSAAARQGDVVAKEQARIIVERLATEPRT
jgi:uncharacterized protein